jgi:dolichyl-phosphate-mannose--protein O-mannosyl transferase
MEQWLKHLRCLQQSIQAYWQAHPQLQFWLHVTGMGLVTLLAHFWRLDALNEFVFDEVYYPKFGLDYLQGNPLFDAHPPLGKYIIALGIQLFGYNPFGYRFFNAIAGSLIPVITCALAYQLSTQGLQPRNSSPTTWPLLAGWFTAMDGLLLVESRLGLINIYIVLFGMLSQLCFVMALKHERRRWAWTIATGIMLGAACSVKWNGLAYLVGIGAITLIIWWRYGQRLTLLQFRVGLLEVPIATYLLIWIPHVLTNSSPHLWELHSQILGFHQNLGADKPESVHTYCSAWWSWPLMLRPIAYYYKVHSDGTINYINAMGNPILYWLGAIAILLCLILCLDRIRNWWVRFWKQGRWVGRNLNSDQFPIYIPLYLLSSFAGHFLPWSLSRRCIFLYHYMPASVFAFMAIAYVTAWGSTQTATNLPKVSKYIVVAIALAFIFWLPIYIGLPITGFYQRLLIWFPSWS